ncbi:MAG: YHS domain-containing protein [Salaquimonas sp.]|nr:YHS domain-containing protein [Salaquimonas sp.]
MALARLVRIAAIVLALVLASASAVFAGEAEIYTGEIPGVAINGYDPVAYFTEDKPVAGSEAITASWKGATWRFASEANKAAFVENPEKYAPQYGGYCAYAVAQGATASTVPEAFTVVNDKLYLNFSSGVRQLWRKDTAGNISKADTNWPKVLE